MALAIKVESIDDIDEKARDFYKENEDGTFSLDADLSGYESADDVKGLKSALEREREERRLAKEKADKLEAERQEDERKRQTEQGEFKSLFEQEQEKRSQAEKERDEARQQITQGKIQSEASNMAASLTKDTGRAELLAEKAAQYAEIVDGKVVYKVGGIEKTGDQMKEYLAEKYAFLADASGASGGGANGGKGSGAVNKLASEMSDKEKTAYIAQHGTAKWRQKVSADQAKKSAKSD